MTRYQRQKAWRTQPRLCLCGRPGVKALHGGYEWICARCLHIEAENQEARLKFARRAHVEVPIYEEYRLCLPVR